MKTKAIFLAVALFTALSCTGASEGARTLLKADAIKVDGNEAIATGSASVTIGDLRFESAEIVVDREKMLLKCRGDVTMRSAATILNAKALTLDVAGGQIMLLSRAKVTIPDPNSEGWRRFFVPDSPQR